MSSVSESPTNKPTVVILLTPDMRAKLIPASAEKRLAEVASVRAPQDGDMTAENLPNLVDGAVAVITGWGTPPLDETLLAHAKSLKLVAHAAGSVRHLVPFAAIEEGRLHVTHAAIHIGEAVSEFVMAQVLSFLRHPAELADGMRNNEPWFDLRTRLLGRLLGEQTVGLLGAGYIGRIMMRLFRAFNARVLVYDPYLTEPQAYEMSVELCGLDDLLRRSDIVSLHVPSLPETRHMIGADQLAMIKDGALFINTARGAIVDEQALIAELRKGRFTAVLDVYEKEPLSHDSPLRTLPNAILAPHAAGHSHETYLRQGATAVDEVCRMLAGEPYRHEVTKAVRSTMA
jgi:phosphoglycerate dehydrogenase-like enzyme